MVDQPNLGKAARTLEDAFFAGESARLLERMRQQTQKEERRKALREVVSIRDDDLIDHLLEMGIGPETAVAVTLVPLAMVAWADGSLQPKEREAILNAAGEKGIKPGGVGYQMLENLLDRPPAPALIDAWKRMTQAMWPALSPQERHQIRQAGLERTRAVAEAAGGFLGLVSSVSAREKEVLNDIATILTE
jgi:hypothetical protein